MNEVVDSFDENERETRTMYRRTTNDVGSECSLSIVHFWHCVATLKKQNP